MAKDLFAEFINGMGFDLPDKDEQLVDAVLAKYLKLEGGIDKEKRDLLVRIYKKSKKVGKGIQIDEKFMPYLKASFNAIFNAADKPTIAMMATFILGYSMRALQEEEK